MRPRETKRGKRANAETTNLLPPSTLRVSKAPLNEKTPQAAEKRASREELLAKVVEVKAERAKLEIEWAKKDSAEELKPRPEPKIDEASYPELQPKLLLRSTRSRATSDLRPSEPRSSAGFTTTGSSRESTRLHSRLENTWAAYSWSGPFGSYKGSPCCREVS